MFLFQQKNQDSFNKLNSTGKMLRNWNRSGHNNDRRIGTDLTWSGRLGHSSRGAVPVLVCLQMALPLEGRGELDVRLPLRVQRPRHRATTGGKRLPDAAVVLCVVKDDVTLLVPVRTRDEVVEARWQHFGLVRWTWFARLQTHQLLPDLKWSRLFQLMYFSKHCNSEVLLNNFTTEIII